MVRIGIAEDDQDCIDQLQDYLSRYQKETGETFHVQVFRDGAQLTFDYQPVFDILLLDVEMPNMDGITAAGHIREIDQDVTILFITNMAQYAIKGYSVRARAYLLKPLNYYGFFLELQDAIASLKRKEVSALLLTTEDGMVKVPVGKVLYVESQKHYLLIHTADDAIRIRSAMKPMEDRLEGCFFARSSVSFLVNLAHVDGIHGDCVAVAGRGLPISRQKRKDFIAALTAYLGGSSHAQ